MTLGNSRASKGLLRTAIHWIDCRSCLKLVHPQYSSSVECLGSKLHLHVNWPLSLLWINGRVFFCLGVNSSRRQLLSSSLIDCTLWWWWLSWGIKNCTHVERLGKNSCWLWHGNQLRQNQNSRQQHKAKTIYQEVNQSSQTEDGTSLKEVLIRLTGIGTLSHGKATTLENKVISFPVKIKLLKSLRSTPPHS